jgi:hypothetical protein
MEVTMKTSCVSTLALAALFALAALPAEAMTKQQSDGYENCTAWCHANNKTPYSKALCVDRCWVYWTTHSSIGPVDPTHKPNIGGAGSVGVTTTN